MNISNTFHRSIREFIFLMLLLLVNISAFSQGYNHTWLLGTDVAFQLGRINFYNNSYNLISEQRKMAFKATQGNISDVNGNFLMSSNGLWILNANNDTMFNSIGLNPTGTNSANTVNMPHSNLILPFPDDTNKFIIFHHTSTFDGVTYPAFELYYSMVDMTLDGGLGGVTQKNIVIIQDTLGWGLAACRHANGSDWWIVMSQLENDTIYKILLTNSGIDTITTQNLNFNTNMWGTVTQPTFSSDGTKFAYSNSFFINGAYNLELRYADFDRCSGNFYNTQVIDIEYGIPGTGVAFSPNSKYLYVSSYQKVFQLNTDTSDIETTMKVVAEYDGFMSPFTWCCQTDFKSMYLAANGKIYITSGSAVGHHHIINIPDNADTLCEVIQHGLYLDGIWNFRSVPNHPNYYLGCDTTCTPCLLPPVGINDFSHDFKFSVYPNPSNGNFNIIYLLPQNKEGKLEVFDVTGKVVYQQYLPQWSTLQQITLPNFIANGLYNVIITSDSQRVNKKIAIIRD